MPATASVDLGLRRVPVQKRGRKTFESILDAAASCLRENGVGNLSTNMIAERAGVNIATLYSYFPNKESILREMMVRSEQERMTVLAPAIEGLADPSWRESLDKMTSAMAEFLVSSPVSLELRRAVAATPELRPLAREGDGAVAMAVAEQIRVRNPKADARRVRAASEVAVLGISGVLDVYCNDGSIDPALVSEVTGMAGDYLAPFLDGR